MEVGSSMEGSRCTSAEVDTQVPISFSPLLTGRSGFAKSERGQGNTDAHNSNLAITALVSRMSEHQYQPSNLLMKKINLLVDPQWNFHPFIKTNR